jgi:circadian clock protein KaiC
MEKTATGVPGLDEITNGGLPRGRITLLTGEVGAGKTILAMQILVAGATRFAEPGVFVSFEEHTDEIASSFESFGWSVTTAARARLPDAKPDAVVVVDANLSPEVVNSGAFDISGILAAVNAAVAATNARRVAFDGIDMLLDQLDDPRERRREMLRLREWTRSAGVTTIVTSKQGVDGISPQEGYEFLQYMMSGVIGLERSPKSSRGERTLRILKLRGSGHSAKEHPFVIRGGGIAVGAIGPVRLLYEALHDHVSSGIARLDAMLGGGYYRASSILISGAPGTAKSTLCGAFISAACERGERGLLISFDEAFSQIDRNLRSVNIHLGRYVESGLLATAGLRTGRLSAEEHFYRIMELIDAHNPQVITIDPVSALDKVADDYLAGALAERLIDEAKMRGATIIVTSLLGNPSTVTESSRAQISSIADTWIQLSFSIVGGERNRALTIIKSRGNAHSNQVRELILSSHGLDLTDVYAQGGAVLMGTARMEQELADQAEEDLRRREAQKARREIEEAEARLKVKLQEIEMELAALARRKSESADAARARETSQALRMRRILERRAPNDGLEIDAEHK